MIERMGNRAVGRKLKDMRMSNLERGNLLVARLWKLADS